MLMHFTDLPEGSAKSKSEPVTDESKAMSSFALITLLDQASRDALDKEFARRGPLFQAALNYGLEWVCVSYWRMGSYPAQVIAASASKRWLRYVTWCARKNINDPLAGRLVDVLGRMWAWLEEPYLDQVSAATKATEKSVAVANLKAYQIELFDRAV